MANSGTQFEAASDRPRGGPLHALPQLDRAALEAPAFHDPSRPRIAGLFTEALARHLLDAEFEQVRLLLAEMRSARNLPKNFEPVAAWHEFVCDYHDVQSGCESWNEAITVLHERWRTPLGRRKTVKSVCPPVFEALTQAWRAVFNDCCEAVLEQLSGGSDRSPVDELSMFQDDVLAATVKVCGLDLPEGIEIQQAGQCARDALAQESQAGEDVGRRLAELKRSPVPPLVQLAELTVAVARRSAAEYSLHTLAEILRTLAPAAEDDSYAHMLADRLDGLCGSTPEDETASVSTAYEQTKCWLSALLALPDAAADDRAASDLIQQLKIVAEEFEGARPHLETVEQWRAAAKRDGAVATDQSIQQLRSAIAKMQRDVIAPLIGDSTSQSLANALQTLRPTCSVFLSHSNQDRGVLEHAVNQPLRRAGFKVFFTSGDGDLRPGVNFAQAIQRALHECDCFVVAVTEHAAASRWVPNEVNIVAKRNPVPSIVPICLDQTSPDAVHPTLSMVQSIFFCDDQGDATPPALQRGFKKLLMHLDDERQARSTGDAAPEQWLEQLQSLAAWDERLTQQLVSLRIAQAMLQALSGQIDEARAACSDALSENGGHQVEFDDQCREAVDQAISALGEVSRLTSQLGSAIGSDDRCSLDWTLEAATVDTKTADALGAAAGVAKDQLARVKLPYLDDAGAAVGRLTTLVDSCQRITRFHDLWAEAQLDVAGRDFSAAAEKAAQLAALSPAAEPIARLLNELTDLGAGFNQQREAGDFDPAQEQINQMQRSRDALDELGRPLLDECLKEWIATSEHQLNVTRKAYAILQEHALPCASEGKYRQALTALDEALALGRDGEDGLGREGLSLPEVSRWYKVVKALLELQDKLEGGQCDAAETSD